MASETPQQVTAAFRDGASHRSDRHEYDAHHRGRGDPRSSLTAGTGVRRSSAKPREPAGDVRLPIDIRREPGHLFVSPATDVRFVMLLHSASCTPFGTPAAREPGACPPTRG